MTINLESLLPWGPAKEVSTRNGDRILSTAKATEEFWNLWRTNKTALKAAGVSVQPVAGTKDWMACLWRPLNGQEVVRREETMEASRATDADVTIPCPDGIDYLPYQRAGIVFALKLWGEM